MCLVPPFPCPPPHRCCCPGDNGRWERGAGRTSAIPGENLGRRGEPSSSGPPTCPGGLDSAGRGGGGGGGQPIAFKRPLPPGPTKAHLPSWTSSAGINIIKDMFSLPAGFTVCWERKNKSFIPTRAENGARTSPAEPGNVPVPCRRGGPRWAGLGPGGMRHGAWWGGESRRECGGRVRQTVWTAVRSPDSPHQPCSGAAGRLRGIAAGRRPSRLYSPQGGSVL